MAAKSLLSLRSIGIASVTVIGTGLGVTAYQYNTALPSHNNTEPRMVKISELPVYGSPEAAIKVLPEEIGPLRQSIKSVRVVVWDWLDSVQSTTDKIQEKMQIGYAHTQSGIEMLRSNPSTLPRLGFIAGAGATGVLLAYKRNIFRKGLYGSILALTATSLCYPEETVNLVINQYKDIKQSVLGPSTEEADSSPETSDKKDS